MAFRGAAIRGRADGLPRGRPTQRDSHPLRPLKILGIGSGHGKGVVGRPSTSQVRLYWPSLPAVSLAVSASSLPWLSLPVGSAGCLCWLSLLAVSTCHLAGCLNGCLHLPSRWLSLPAVSARSLCWLSLLALSAGCLGSRSLLAVSARCLCPLSLPSVSASLLPWLSLIAVSARCVARCLCRLSPLAVSALCLCLCLC